MCMAVRAAAMIVSVRPMIVPVRFLGVFLVWMIMPVLVLSFWLVWMIMPLRFVRSLLVWMIVPMRLLAFVRMILMRIVIIGHVFYLIPE